MEEEEDVAEIKKAMATGSVSKDNANAISSGTQNAVVCAMQLAHILYPSPPDCMLLLRVHPDDSREQGTVRATIPSPAVQLTGLACSLLSPADNST